MSVKGVNQGRSKGRVISIQGQIAEVEFLKNPPELHEILFTEEGIRMKVYASSEKAVFYCLVLSGVEKLYRGLIVVGSGEVMSVPVGEEILGRVINIYGETVDGGEQIKSKIRLPIYSAAPSYENVSMQAEIWETGIKVIDLFAPLCEAEKWVCSAERVWVKPSC